MKPQTSIIEVRRRSSSIVRRISSDDRGVAALEGIIVIAILAGVFLGSLFLSMWGTGLQSAQMGARLLAFDAGDIELAQLGRTSRVPTQQFVTESWDTLVDTLIAGDKANWLGGKFALSNDHYSGSVTGTTQGRLPGESRSLFDYSPASMGYRAQNWTAAFNSWGTPETTVRSTFLHIAFNVGRYQVDTTNFVSMALESIPNQPAILETIFGRVGVR